jgi:hypothetical protein
LKHEEEVVMIDHTTIEAAGRVRYLLGEAAQELERAVSAPARGSAIWRKQVDYCLGELRTTLIEHIELTEGADGLLDQITEDEPRLVPDVEVILADHAELCEAVDLAKDLVEQDRADDAHEIRAAVLDLIGRLYAHRHRGSDLVFDAYNVDIGGLGGD